MSACVPAPQHDELLRSYICRLDACSGHISLSLRIPTIAELSQATNLDEKAIVYDHSCLAYARFVNFAQAGVPAHLHSDRDLNGRVFWMAKRSVKFCPDCLSQDLEMLGCGYWRRAHQLPGVELCSTHQAELIEVERSAAQRVLTSRSVENHLDRQAASRHPVVARFAKLSEMALRAPRSIAPGRIADVLSARAQQRGLRLRGQQVGQKFSDLVRDQMPPAWLNRHFGGTKPEKTMDGIFCTHRSPYRTASYLLAMAMLWDTAEEAMTACTEVPTADADPESSVGMRMVKAVLAGASLRTACRQENGRSSDFESALRQLFSGQPVAALFLGLGHSGPG